MSALARKFAFKENSINIFILSMCRTFLQEKEVSNLKELSNLNEGEE
jgi:hypothetical protein